MSRRGHRLGLLDDLHATGCEREEVIECQPLAVPAGAWNEPSYADHADRGAEIVVVVVEWCEECGAADWELV